MSVHTINRVKTITLPLSSNDESSIVTIYENSPSRIRQELVPDYEIVSVNTFVKNLKVFAKIESIPEAALPNFELTDSETQKLYKTLDIEWKSPRKQLELFISSDDSDWYPVGFVSLLNPYGYPYRVYNLMDLFTDNLALELGENSKIGIKAENVGHGFLAPEDKVTIHGSYVEEIVLTTPFYKHAVSSNRARYSPTVAPLAGIEGMQQLLADNIDDGSLHVGEIGFEFPVYLASFRDIYVGSNSYLTFGYGSREYSDLTRSNPGAGLFINSGDRSYQKVFAKQDQPGQSFRVRYEGGISTDGILDAPDVVWETTLFIDGTIQLVIGNLNLGEEELGQSYLTDGTGLRFVNFVFRANTSYVFLRDTSKVYSVLEGSYV